MSNDPALSPGQLVTHCDPDALGFTTTDELLDLEEVVGQKRAIESVRFGIGIQCEGYNLYVMGPSGMGKHTLVRQYIETKACDELTPPDWCYINNFDQPHKPRVLRLPSGKGRQLADDMKQLVDELKSTLPAAFEADAYRDQLQNLETELKNRQEEAFNKLSEHAEAQNIRLFRTPSGFAFAPVRKGEVLGPEEFAKLPEDEQKDIEETVAHLQNELQGILKQIPQWRKETRDKLTELNRSVAMSQVGHSIDALRERYEDLAEVLDYLDAVEQDIVVNVRDFIKADDGGDGLSLIQDARPPQHRYQVNVLVDNSEVHGAPVVYLDNPSYVNLTGRAEHLAQMGTLVTDFTLIKPGALHAANGGYLLLDAHKLLTQPYAWEGLKRALYGNEITIEPLEKMLGLLSTVSLEPEPIQLQVKVVLMGDRMLYYLLHEYDPDFAELFKVQADFENVMERNEQNNGLYARLIATICRKELLRPFTAAAVARVIDQAARHVEDAERLTTHMRTIADLLREANYWAAEAGHERVDAADVIKTLEHQRYRGARIREKVQEAILRNTIYIDTDGEKVGQVNGLSVISLGEQSFGQPSRITASVHLGEGHVVDIEREVELGGAIHSKGVMILSAFLAARYAQDHPLSLSASLVFEQSYGMVDGDSASLAELCALISATGEIPIRQRYAMTGSVNQFGEVQPIGGVNEKIEGYFEVCRARGLTGDQGVLIPRSNIAHLMLDDDVVEAVREGQFHIHAIATVDEALSLLTGLEPGVLDQEGNYPEDTINGMVASRLQQMNDIRQQFGEHGAKGKDGNPAVTDAD